MGRGKSGVGRSSTGRSGSYGAEVEESMWRGGSIDRYVVDSEQQALRIAENAPFQKGGSEDYQLTEREETGSYLKHFDSEVISMRASNDTEMRSIQKGYYMNNASVGVEHRVLGNGKELYVVDVSPSVGRRAGLRYTDGRSRLASGFVFSDRESARSAARKALVEEIKSGGINRLLNKNR